MAAARKAARPGKVSAERPAPSCAGPARLKAGAGPCHAVWLQKPVDPILAEAVGRLVGALRARRIVLFGSRAWGSVAADADYDLLVPVDDSTNPRLLEAEAYRALAGLPASFDVLVRSVEWWSDWWDTPFSLERRIETEGVTVHDGG
ncbi:MAG: nucleotidyltransferase domain-containing protein [Deltaproteobacteria bacterium]|nr:nucleotidyltransferase domain-containing protein [Deltaproteobacteria bacterium]